MSHSKNHSNKEINLKRLAESLLKETQQYEEELKELTQTLGESEQEAQKRLEAEIAEDIALSQQTDELTAETKIAPSFDLEEIESSLEAILFMADQPLSAQKLKEVVQPASLPLFQEALTSLQDRYKSPRYGIELVQVNGGYQFRTKVGKTNLGARLGRVRTQKLSSGAMESLAIIAYKQPVLKEELDKIRGVDSSHFLRTLLDRGLIQMAGRSELPGRPILYSTTPQFLELFGLKDLNDLPPLREIEQMVAQSEVKPLSAESETDPRILAMRKMVNDMRMDPGGALQYNPKDDEILLQQIRERVQAIPITTPTLEEKDRAELIEPS